ncbi:MULTISPECIES: hypothetical protein [unclassified Pseudomonas]|uniref:hypothetical protein n=1 Tax=unclassified Pseudomonas TaxID=196821 RepID=UPI001113C17A|nr:MULTISPECIES: hypothetical protein [unclassified Pseudomonas]
MTTLPQRPFAVGQAPRLVNPKQFQSPPFFTANPVADIINSTPIDFLIPNHASSRAGDVIEIYIDKTPTTTPSVTPYATISVDLVPGTNTVAQNTKFQIPFTDARKMLDQVFEMSCASGTPGSPHIFLLSLYFGVTFIKP